MEITLSDIARGVLPHNTYTGIAAQRGFGTPHLERGIHLEMFPRTGYNIRTHESLKLSAAI